MSELDERDVEPGDDTAPHRAMEDHPEPGEHEEDRPRETAVPPTGVEDPPPAEPSSSALVLVIEDEAPVANALRGFAELRGHRVVVATDGEAGLDAFRDEIPSLVFCDLLLPRRDGFRLMEDFQELAPKVPVVVMTGIYKGDTYRQQLAGARAFLTKPLASDEVAAALDLVSEPLPGGARPAGLEPGTPPPRPREARSREPWLPTALVPLPRVLHLLWHDRRTGLLTHRVGERRTVFHVEDGNLRFVHASDTALRLGGILQQLGCVSEDALQRARARLDTSTTPTRLGQLLVDDGALAPEDLARAVQIQLRKMVAAAFNADDGETLFVADALPTDETIVLDADLRAVIVAGCSAWDADDDRLLGHLPDGTCPVVSSADPLDPALRLPPTVRQLLAAVREPTPLADVVAMARLMGLRGRPIVFGLLCAEALEVASVGEEWRRHRPQGVGEGRRISVDQLPVQVLLGLEHARETGVLTVQRGPRTAWIGLRDGAICAAGSDDEGGRLGERLRLAGLITPEQLETALAEQVRRPASPLGRLLVETGAVDATKLLHAVRAQVLAVARETCSLPAWDEAYFASGHVPDVEPIVLGVTTGDVVLDCLRALDVRSLERLAGRLEGNRPRLDPSAAASRGLALTDTERLVIESLPTDTAQLLSALARADRSDEDVIRMAVLVLLLSPADAEATAAACPPASSSRTTDDTPVESIEVLD